MLNFDKILIELSGKIPTGIIDLSDPIHRFELGILLNEYTDNDIASTILNEIDRQYIVEAPAPNGFSAISKETGRTVYFQSSKSREAAIQAGTHTSVASKTPGVVKKLDQSTTKSDTGDGGDGGDGGESLASKISGGAKKDAKKKEADDIKKLKKIATKKIPKVEPVLIKSIPVTINNFTVKNKKLGAINTDHFKKPIQVDDKTFNQSVTTHKFKLVTAKSKLNITVPSDFPKKYTTFIKRSLMLDKTSETKPSLSMVYGHGGAGHIASQFAEVLMMMFAKTHVADDRLKLKNDILSYMDSIDTSSKPIIDKSWVEAAYLQAESLHARLRFKHSDGYTIEQVAWDYEDDVEALGLTDYKNNKGESTDVYFRIKLKNGHVYLLEDSLKKDENVFLLNTTTNEISTFAVKKLPKTIQQQFKKLVVKYNDHKVSSPEKAKIYRQLQQIKAKANDTVPVSIRATSFKNEQLQSAISFANSFEQYIAVSGKKRIVQKIDDTALMKSFGSNTSDKKFAISAIKSLSAGKFGTQEYRDSLKKLTNKSGDRYITKAAVFVARYFSALGNGNISIALDNHYKLAKSFQMKCLTTIVSDSELRDGFMDMINDVFPLKSLFEGEEEADVDSLPVFRDSLTNLFKVKNYEELKTHLIVRRNEVGLYELVYTASNQYEAIPIATINTRQRGVGYDQILSLEMRLHSVFARRIAKSNAELGIMTPGIKAQLEKIGNRPTSTSGKK